MYYYSSVSDLFYANLIYLTLQIYRGRIIIVQCMYKKSILQCSFSYSRKIYGLNNNTKFKTQFLDKSKDI